jgi:hypothetical protein
VLALLAACGPPAAPPPPATFSPSPSAAASAAGPFGGAPHAIPGVIEAEHYDEGPAGLVYHDVTPPNEGVAYRKDTSVDIEGRPDASNLHGIGWTRSGEWLRYTVAVKESGVYAVRIPVASDGQGGTFHLEVAGRDVTGPIAVPDTGGWDKLVVVKRDGIALEAGVQTLRIVMGTEGETRSIGDIDCLTFSR